MAEVHDVSNPDRVSEVFNYLSGQQSAIVRHIGFKGLLSVPRSLELDENLSLWLLKNLDTSSMTLTTDSGASLPLRNVDVHLVLGIPFQGKPVVYDENPSSESVITLKNYLSLDDSPTSLTLSWLQHILTKKYSGSMSLPEMRAFKIAAVLYSMALFLAPRPPRPKFPIGLTTTALHHAQLNEFNWARHVIEALKHSANQVQSQLREGKESVVLYGCSALLQIFYIDNLNFGARTPYHMELPRVSSYKTYVINKLAVHDFRVAKARSPSKVCYSRGWRYHVALDSSDQDFYDNHYSNTTCLGPSPRDKGAHYFRG